MRSKSWSLEFELSELRGAVCGARNALEPVRFGCADDAETARDRAAEASAILSLVDCRMSQLLAMLRGEVPRDALAMDHNRVPTGAHGDGDIVFESKRRARKR